jgi:hypothetical protein
VLCLPETNIFYGLFEDWGEGERERGGEGHGEDRAVEV